MSWYLWIFVSTLIAKLEDHSVWNNFVNVFLTALHI
jgi:hypothetical protein